MCTFFIIATISTKYIYYYIDIHYIAAGGTAGEIWLSCSLLLKMKTLLSFRCCCLGNLVTLTLLSTLFTTCFIKCVAAGNQNKTSGRAACLEMQSLIKYFQKAMFLQATSALYIINYAPGSYSSESMQGSYIDDLLQNPCVLLLQIQI